MNRLKVPANFTRVASVTLLLVVATAATAYAVSQGKGTKLDGALPEAEREEGAATKIPFSQGILRSVEVVFDDGSSQKLHPTTGTLQVGNDSDSEPAFLIVHVDPKAKNLPPLRVRQRAETSIALSDSGPHLELTNWKHGYTPWIELVTTSTQKYTVIDQDTEDFPDVTNEEIKQQVRKSVMESVRQGQIPSSEAEEEIRRWSEVVDASCNPASGCAEVTRKSFEIEANIDGTWKVLQRVNVDLPLGC